MSSSEFQATAADLRQAVRKLGAHILRAQHENRLPDGEIGDFLPPGVTMPEAWMVKGNRYGTGNAISAIMREDSVAGRGLISRFRDVPAEIPGRKPHTRFRNALKLIFAASSRRIQAATGQESAIMDKFSEHGADLPTDVTTIKLGEGVLHGADYQDSMHEYTVVAADLMRQTEPYSGFSAERRRDVAHHIIMRAIGRDASMHGEDFAAADTVLELHRDGEVQLHHGGRAGDRLDLGRNRRAAILRDGAEHATPPVGCLAHQLRPGEPETDLQTFVHAGINLAYDLGMFGTPAAPAEAR